MLAACFRGPGYSLGVSSGVWLCIAQFRKEGTTVDVGQTPRLLLRVKVGAADGSGPGTCTPETCATSRRLMFGIVYHTELCRILPCLYFVTSQPQASNHYTGHNDHNTGHTTCHACAWPAAGV